MERQGWTIENLKELFDRVIEERDRRVDTAFASAKEATLKAETAAERRFSLLNEFRAQQADEARKYITREMVDQQVSGIEHRLLSVESGLATLQGRSLALAAFGTVFGGLVGASIIKFIG